MSQMKGISIIIRTTEACNLSCKYCYVRPSTHNKILSLSLFEQMMQQLCELGYKHITLFWHGGEPLLAGRDYFQDAVAIEHRVSEEYHSIVQNKMQTNGTLLTQEYVDFFQANNFRVGLSLDGDRTTNDHNRVYQGGRSTFADALRGLELMRTAGLDTSILSVLTREHIHQLDEYYAFVKNLGVRTFKVNPCLINKQEHSESQVQPLEWGWAMSRLFDLWFYDDNPPSNREFSNIIKSFFVGYSTQCVYNRTCFSDFLSVVPSGDVFPCARLINEDPVFALGNITERMSSVFENHQRLVRHYDDVGCEMCQWQAICHGGCTAYSYWAHQEVNRKDFLCEG